MGQRTLTLDSYVYSTCIEVSIRITGKLEQIEQFGLKGEDVAVFTARAMLALQALY